MQRQAFAIPRTSRSSRAMALPVASTSFAEQDAESPSGAGMQSQSRICRFPRVRWDFGGLARPAGMFSILNQKLGARVGNRITHLYNLAAKEGSAGCNSSTGPGAQRASLTISPKGRYPSLALRGRSNCYAKTNGDGYGVLALTTAAGYGTIDSSGYPGDLAWNTAAGYDYGTGLGPSMPTTWLINGLQPIFGFYDHDLALSSTTFTHGTYDHGNGQGQLDHRRSLGGRFLQRSNDERFDRLRHASRWDGAGDAEQPSRAAAITSSRITGAITMAPISLPGVIPIQSR